METAGCIAAMLVRQPYFGTEKTVTARDVTDSALFSLCPEIGQFSPHFGAISLVNSSTTQQTWRKGKKSTGENSKNPVETAPRNCRFLSLVVVERVLSIVARTQRAGFEPRVRHGGRGNSCVGDPALEGGARTGAAASGDAQTRVISQWMQLS